MPSRGLCILFIVIILVAAFSTPQVKEEFGMFDNFKQAISDPGGFLAHQGEQIWDSVRGPATFARNIFYNVAPNYTWVTRYYNSRNEGIRANKGLPPLLPSATDASKVNFNFEDVNASKSWFLNKVNNVSP